MKSLKVRFQGVITENAVFRCGFYMLIVIAFRQAGCADSPTNGTKSSSMLPSTASSSKLNDNFYNTNNLQVGPSLYVLFQYCKIVIQAHKKLAKIVVVQPNNRGVSYFS